MIKISPAYAYIIEKPNGEEVVFHCSGDCGGQAFIQDGTLIIMKNKNILSSFADAVFAPNAWLSVMPYSTNREQ